MVDGPQFLVSKLADERERRISIMTDIVIAIASVAYVVLTFTVVLFMYLQTRGQRKATQLQMFHLAAVRMEETRADRGKLRKYVRGYKDIKTPVSFPLPDDVKIAADRVSRAFDYLGLLDRTRVVDPKFINFFYAVPLVLLYKDILGQYVADLRKPSQRGPTHLWELVQFYDRVRNVPDNHPAISGRPDWQKNPRLKTKSRKTGN